MVPNADIPVVQLSIHRGLSPEQHINLGRALTPLRDEGVLIVGSGNVTHNLPDAFSRMRSGDSTTPAWASDFDGEVVAALTERDTARLQTLLGGPLGRQAHPTPDHYLPLLYAYGASTEADSLVFPIEGFDLGSVSMRTARFS
jgi:4,5-DOPA dioxygenase extradiol